MLRTLFVAVAVLVSSAPAFAAVPPPNPLHQEGGRRNHVEKLEHRIDHAVQAGKLSPEQGQKLKDEAESIRAEVQANRAANPDGKLTPEQREHVKSELQALRQKVRAATGAPAAPPAGK